MTMKSSLANTTSRSGFSLVEVIIVSAILLLVFGGLFASFRYSLSLITESRGKMTALALMTDRLEHIRSLPYDSVGTVFGIPNGPIPQHRIIQRNNLTLHEQVLIEFVDDPADGLDVLDNNGILNDYKRVKIEYSWHTGGATTTIATVSNIVPRAIETDIGGGTIRVNVFGANAQPLSGINVRLVLASTTHPINVTRQTGPTGSTLFTGAPASSGYEIFVSEPGYSSDQTYVATTSLPYPHTLPVAVLEGDITTMNFQIDRLSTTTVLLVANRVFGNETEEFSDLSGLATSSQVASNGTALTLLPAGGGLYPASGEAWLNPISPTTIQSWGIVSLRANTPMQTTASFSFYTSTSSADLIPDSVLPGNSTGFTTDTIDLRGLPVALYSQIVPRVVLTTTASDRTPSVDRFELIYLESEASLPNQDFTLTSNRSIGSSAAFTPVPKWTISTSTDSTGARLLPNIEWGGYNPTVPGRSIQSICPSGAFVVQPGTVSTTTVALGAPSTHSLRVVVKDGSGQTVPNANVTLRIGAAETNRVTDWCGQVFFGGLTEDAHSLEIAAFGHPLVTENPLNVSGQTVREITL